MSDLRARIERMAAVVEDHLLTGPAPGQCRCGWGQEPQHLGKAHSEHVARMIVAALPEVDRDEVAEDLATADLAWADHFHREPSDLGRIRALTDCLRAEFYLIPKGDA